MKYNEGDRVRIKSIDWYNENKDADGIIDCGVLEFDEELSAFCGKIVTINSLPSTNAYDRDCYTIIEDNRRYNWSDEMIEGLVEEETKSGNGLLDEYEELTDRAFKGGYEKCKSDIELNGFLLPEGYQFTDENGNIINVTKIVLEKKKKEYPKTYEECCKILGDVTAACWSGYKCGVLGALNKLLICRDAYWKIAGDEMGLDKPWEPDWLDDDTKKYVITSTKVFETFGGLGYINYILVFPTEEMRDTFYENFKELIEICKELL